MFDYGVRHVADAVRAAVDGLPASASSYEKVRAAVGAHLESFFVYGDYTATNIRVFRQAPRAVQRRNRSLRDRYESYWQTLLEEAKRRGEIRRGVDLAIARLFLFGGMNHTLEWYRHRGASFRESIQADPAVAETLDAATLDACFDPTTFLANVGGVFDRLEKLPVEAS